MKALVLSPRLLSASNRALEPEYVESELVQMNGVGLPGEDNQSSSTSQLDQVLDTCSFFTGGGFDFSIERGRPWKSWWFFSRRIYTWIRHVRKSWSLHLFEGLVVLDLDVGKTSALLSAFVKQHTDRLDRCRL